MESIDFFTKATDVTPYAVQYVGEVVVKGKEPQAVVIETHIMLAKNYEEAKSLAEKHIHIMDHSYHNDIDHDLVTWKALGVHSIEEIEFTYSDKVLPISKFLFSPLTTKEDLIDAKWPRKDLPNTDG